MRIFPGPLIAFKAMISAGPLQSIFKATNSNRTVVIFSAPGCAAHLQLTRDPMAFPSSSVLLPEKLA